jgi:hypothetical protein
VRITRDFRGAVEVARPLLFSPAIIAMLSRITACCLALLVLAPFTAPFRTIDLAMLLRGSQAHAPVKTPASSTLTNEMNLASVPTISRTGRIRLLPLSGLPASTVATVGAATGLARGAASDGGLCGGAALSTILRL